MNRNQNMTENLEKRIPCGGLSDEDISQNVVTVAGWVFHFRDQGGIIFIDLRDRSGILQIVFDRSNDEKLWSIADKLRSEDVILVQGVVRLRSEETINLKLKTGRIELLAHKALLLNKCIDLPVSVEDHIDDVSEENRLKFRYLDMRRSEMQRTLQKRHEFFYCLRTFLNKKKFWEVETPVLNKSTPEGARDFLVPSRLNSGRFYALPQSPQIFKQILMTSQVEHYFQIARCFRDEDLRKDRQPEFTQLDMEMSFVTQEMVMRISQEMLSYACEKVFDIHIEPELEQISYKDALEQFGTDTPDNRFDMKLTALDSWALKTDFQVFKKAISSGGRVMALCVPGGGDLSRKELDDLTQWVREDFKAGGLAWIKYTENHLESVVTKFLPERTQTELIEKTKAKNGDIILFGADKPEIVFPTLSALRSRLAKKYNKIPAGTFKALWVTKFPLFVWDEQKMSFDSLHNPFSSPDDPNIEFLTGYAQAIKKPEAFSKDEKDRILQVKSKAYDMVLNGVEIGGGSIRNHKATLQQAIFHLLGMSKEDSYEKFGFLLKALSLGTPPHGGIAFGLDRILMILLGKESIREVIPFPKTQKGQCLMSEAPSSVEPKQLNELSLRVRPA